ncbi:MAG: hypothetical protein ACREC0_04625 [Methylocella sp.]
MMVDQDVIECLDRALAKRKRHRRLDLAEMPNNSLKALAVPCEQRAKKVVALVNSRIPSEKRRQIHIVFCEDERYGAFAICKQYDYIVLNIGIILRLLHFCERMMDNPQLWPDVRPEAFRGFSVVSTFECFDLIVRHELAHLLLGHLAKDAQDAKHIQMVSQALEFAADGHSAIWGFEALRKREKVCCAPRGMVAEGYREFHHDALANYLCALFFMFRMGDERAPKEGKLANASHPPAPMRFNVASIHLGEHFKRTGDKEAYDQLVRADTWERGESTFAKVLDREPETGLKTLTMRKESEEHYNEISNLAPTMPRHWFGLAD